MRWTVIDSPIGDLSLAVDADGLCGVRFGAVGAGAANTNPSSTGPTGVGSGRTGSGGTGSVGVGVGVGPAGDERVLTARRELEAYFAGELTDFSVPLSVPAGSEFERAVWAQLSRIPYGEMQTYGEVAKVVGDAGAARAVGIACNRNPLPIVVPCHRVVGAGGKLVGFGGGLDRKRHLLELEARVTLETAWL